MAGAWVFDVDGCLVDSLTAMSLRPLAGEALDCVRRGGRPVVLWSAGGRDYARQVAERVGIAHLVDGYYEKERGIDGRWSTEAFPSAHRPDTCVDDQPEGVPAGVRALPVPPYVGANPHDRGLAAVLAAARALPDAGR